MQIDGLVWTPLLVALIGALSAGITLWVTRRQRNVETEVRQTEAAVAGLAVLVGELQEERAVCRAELKEVRAELDQLRLSLKVPEPWRRRST